MSMRELREKHPEHYESAALQAIRERHAALRQALQDRSRGAPRTASKTVLKTVTRARSRRAAASADGLETPAASAPSTRRSARTAAKAARPVDAEVAEPSEAQRSARKRSAATLHPEPTLGPLGLPQTRARRAAPRGLVSLAEDGDEGGADENDESAEAAAEDEDARALHASRPTWASKRRAVAPSGATFGGLPLATPLPFQGKAEAVPVTFVRQVKPGSRLGAQIGDGDAVVVQTRDGTQYATALDGNNLASIPEKHREEVQNGLASLVERMSGLVNCFFSRSKKDAKQSRARAKK